MNFIKSFYTLTSCLIVSSCALLDLDYLDGEGITETKDVIKEDSKFTSGKIEKFFDSKKPITA